MSKATTTSQTRAAAAVATQQRLLASPIGILMSKLGQNILDIEGLFPPAELSAVADALGDENHPIYAGLSCLQNGEMYDIMRMPREGPEVVKIKLNTIPTTNFAIRQYPLPIGSQHGEKDRQAFLFDFYHVGKNSQLSEVPNGYTFQAMSAKTGRVGNEAVAESEAEIVMQTDMWDHMEMQPIVLGPYGTTIAIRGVQFEVRRGTKMLLQFTFHRTVLVIDNLYGRLARCRGPRRSRPLSRCDGGEVRRADAQLKAGYVDVWLP